MRLQPSGFEKVVIGSQEHFDVSPAKPRLGWTGVLITAPSLASGELGGRLPVCLYFKLPIDPLSQALIAEIQMQRSDGVSLVAHESLEDPAVEEQMPAAKITHEQLASMTVGGYRTFDLQAALPLPAKALALRVQVRIRGLSSNVAEIHWSP